MYYKPNEMLEVTVSCRNDSFKMALTLNSVNRAMATLGSPVKITLYGKLLVGVLGGLRSLFYNCFVIFTIRIVCFLLYVKLTRFHKDLISQDDKNYGSKYFDENFISRI